MAWVVWGSASQNPCPYGVPSAALRLQLPALLLPPLLSDAWLTKALQQTKDLHWVQELMDGRVAHDWNVLEYRIRNLTLPYPFNATLAAEVRDLGNLFKAEMVRVVDALVHDAVVATEAVVASSRFRLTFFASLAAVCITCGILIGLWTLHAIAVPFDTLKAVKSKLMADKQVRAIPVHAPPPATHAPK